MKTVFLFPGQGAQAPGMAKDLWEFSAKVKDLFECASAISGKNMRELLFEGSEDDLKSTDNTQIAITLANISAATVLFEKGIKADFVAGFSIGEYAALWASGVISTEDLFKAVLVRGTVMEKASRGFDSPEGNAGMTAIIGLTKEKIEEVFTTNKLENVYIANHNSPTQLVLAGTARGLDLAEEQCRLAGAMKAVRLKVSGPFHSPLLMSARKDFEAVTHSYCWNAPCMPVISNVNALPIVDGAQAKALAGEQIISAVRWVDTMNYLIANQAGTILEVGPGKVLGGLWRALTRDTKCQAAGTIETINAIMIQP